MPRSHAIATSSRARRALVGVLAVCSLGLLAACDSVAGLPPELVASPERATDLIDGYRSRIGLGALAVDATLDARAQSWANQLAANGSLQHSGNVGQGLSWGMAAENVGVGSNVDTVQRAFEASPDHRANLAKPGFTRVGVGVAMSADGRVFVVQQFLG